MEANNEPKQLTDEEKVAHLESEMKKAKEAGDEEHYKLLYKMWIGQITINVQAGGAVVFQSGNPKNVPPYV